MKYMNQILSIILICAISISAIFICKKLESAEHMLDTKLSDLSRQLQLYANEETSDHDEDILSLYQAASYLKINDAAALLQMVESGELEGTYFQFSSGRYYFVREKLYQWCLSQTELPHR